MKMNLSYNAEIGELTVRQYGRKGRIAEEVILSQKESVESTLIGFERILKGGGTLERNLLPTSASPTGLA